MARDDVEVRVAGQVFTAWESVAITRDVLSAAAGCVLQVGPVTPFPFRPGAPLDVRFGKHRLLAGFVDRAEVGPHERTIVCRDATCDLIDCDPDPDARREWTDAGVDAIAADLAAPFGITVAVEGDVGGPFAKFACEPGEKAWTALERALRVRGVLGFSPGDGRLLLKKPSSSQAAVFLLEGVNLIDWKVSDSLEDRFSTYRVLAQRPTDKVDFGFVTNESNGRADDPDVPRFRPSVKFAESSGTSQDAQERAEWEKRVRAARSTSITCITRDWCKGRNEDGTPGDLWKPDELLRVRIPRHGIDSDWYAQVVEYRRSPREGTLATLKLVPLGALAASPEETPAPKDPLSGIFGGAAAGSLEPEFPEDFDQ
jgi:prophage tail gpP-like protein